MTHNMWPLSSFRFDDLIHAAEVTLVDDAPGEGMLMPLGLALEIAEAKGANLVAWWPADETDDSPDCILRKVTLPLRWEQLPPDQVEDPVDERLWFEASCGERDLLEGNGHTFPGGMRAWCPHEGVGYTVYLSDMGEMSVETTYFVKGFLSGNEPAPPLDDDGDIEPGDLPAWISATKRFRRTGAWYGRWGACNVCGRVLLPDSCSDKCEEHED